MKMVKSLMLGSAAGLIAMSGAQAADLPLKAKAVEYVRICSLYGAGFYYIPGTDTCIKLGGYVRADLAINTNSVDTGNISGAAGAKNRFSNAYSWRGRQDLSIDTRTATEYGVVRTFGEVTLTWTDGSFAGAGTNALNGHTTYSGDGVAGGSLGVYYAYIQFAGFTIGKAISQFSAPWTNYPGNNFDGLVGGGGDVTGVNQFTYTADFGQGITAAISAQDQTQYYQAGVMNLSAGGNAALLASPLGGFGASDYANTASPDFVGMFRIDQAWGMVQLSAAAHDNHAAYYGATENTGHPDDRWGWAAQLALQIKNIPTGPGDTINVQGVFTDGATRYNIQDLAGQAGANQIFGGTSNAAAYQSLGIGFAPDTVFAAGTSQQLVQTWGMRGAFNHNWDPYWSSSVYGAYAAVRYNDTSKALLCNTAGIGFDVAAGAGLTSCNPDYNISQLGFITRWTPVKNLTFSGDVVWTHLDTKMAGLLETSSAGIAKPGNGALYEMKNQDTVLMLLRAQRNF